MKRIASERTSATLVAERAADAMADRALFGQPGRAERPACACGGGCPRCAAPTARPLPNRASRTGHIGAPLDPATRGFMQARFASDFGAVRVHADSPAAAAAGARAFTYGTDITFAPGHYAPGSRSGQHLIAHELAHVLQQARHGPTLQHKKDDAATPPPSFYQGVVDELASQDADQARQRQQGASGWMVHEQMNYGALKALLPLAQAVDQDRVKDIPALVDAFIAVDTGPPFAALSRTLLVELSARLFTLGLEAQADKLRTNYSRREAAFSWIKSDTGLHARDIAIFGAIIDRQLALADYSSAAASGATLMQHVRVLPLLRDELLDISEFEKGINRDRSYDPQPTHGQARWDALIKLLGRLVTAMSFALQSLFDRAAAELGSGKTTEGTATLALVRSLVETQIVPALNASKANADGRITIGDLKVVLAPSEMNKGKGEVHDAFDAQRKVAVSAYTPGQTGVQQLQAPIIAVFDKRVQQVAAMAEIYGASSLLRDDKPGEKDRKTEAGRNAATLKKMFAEGGGLRLDSDDDWRRFVLRKHEDLTSTGGLDDGQALSAVMSTLYDYLAAFTLHARFTDIYDRGDFKDAYFNKPFPRTLAGQLVHDCGVYAMRVAYILSLVRDQLGLRIRFIRLPAHVGLVIDGEGVPTFIAHNDHFEEYSSAEFAEIRRQLQAKGSGPIDDDQLTAEIAGHEFISGPLDMPYAFSDVPSAPAAGSTSSAAATQQAMWRQYQKVATQDVFGPASTREGDPGYLFHKRYLAVTEQFRQLHNDRLLPFWNEVAPKAWTALRQQFEAGGRKAINGSELQGLLGAYLAQYDRDMQPTKDGRAAIEADERAISEQLRKTPALQAPNTKLTDGARIAAIAPHGTDLFRARVAKVLADAKAAPERAFDIAQLVATDLAPPFMPTETNKLFKYD